MKAYITRKLRLCVVMSLKNAERLLGALENIEDTNLSDRDVKVIDNLYKAIKTAE